MISRAKSSGAILDTYDSECPWCGKHLDDLWDMFVEDHPDAVETTCHHCERPIRISESMEYIISAIQNP